MTRFRAGVHSTDREDPVDSPDLAAFLLARIEEDEAIAREARGPRWVRAIERSGSPGHWRGVAAHLVTLPGNPFDQLAPGDTVARCAPGPDDAHIARHDPARVLADCAAKRRLVQLAEADLDDSELAYYARRTLLILASAYFSHADFDPAWKLD